MYASVRRYQTDASQIDELTRQVNEGFLPIVSSVPGFVAYFVVNAGNGTVASVSVFDSQEGAEASNQKAASWVQDNLASMMQGPPQITAGDVMAHKTA